MIDVPLHRLIVPSMREQLGTMPAVVVTGARQTGKSVLVRDLAPGRRRYVSCDVRAQVEVAWLDQDVLGGGDGPMTLDDVQREPAVLRTVNEAVDRCGSPGQFLLTESAALLRLRRVVDPLADGVVHLTLWPMTRREQRGLGRGGIWDELLDADDAVWPEVVADQPNEPEAWQELASRGGLPVPALELRAPEERAAWFGDYIRDFVERELFFDGYLLTFGRELQDLSAISQARCFQWLLRVAASELGQRPSKRVLSAGPRAADYVDLLVDSLTLVRLPPYPLGRRSSRPMFSRLYWADTGLALHLAQTRPTVVHLQNLVLGDLLAWRDSRLPRVGLSYWTGTNGRAVDFVVESGRGLLPISVTAAERPLAENVDALRAFRAENPETARAGLLLHVGTEFEWLAPDVFAAPWWRVL